MIDVRDIMILKRQIKKLIPFSLILILGFDACHTRKVAMVHTTESNSSPLYPVHTLAKNPHPETIQINKPRLGFSQYLNYVNAYIQNYSPIAIEEMKEYGVPASIILAQGIHESGAGKSNLATKANNHFGVKCTSDWAGECYFMDDDKPNECFRKYSNSLESFQDHMAFLQRKRYSSLFALGATDYKAWAYGLKTCGYATNPNYPQILIGIIQKYNLNRFDQGKPLLDLTQNSNSSSPEGEPMVKTDTMHRRVYKTDTVYSVVYMGTPHITKDSLTENPVSNTKTIQEISRSGHSDSDFYTVRQGDTLYSIARRFNLSLEQIKDINQLLNSSIKIDQVLRVKP